MTSPPDGPHAGGPPAECSTPDVPAPAARTAALDRVRAILRRMGATDDEIDRAVADDVLDLLTVDRLLVPSGPRYTTAEVSERTGLPAVVLRRFWRALGLLEPADDDPVLTDLDVEAAQLFQTLVRLGITEPDTGIQVARVIGSSMARIAEAGVVRAATSLGAEDDSVMAADAFAGSAGEVLPAMDRLLEYVWRRHVQAVTRRTMLLRTAGRSWGSRQELAVAFADMVGFTVLSQHLSEQELAQVVQRFEEISHDIVTGLGGRVVKMIGDEVMYVVEDVVAAARIAVALSEAYADDDLLSDVRVGLAAGPVLVNDGDYFGATVNLAARIVNIAGPGAVLVSEEVHRQLNDQASGEFGFAPLGRRELKDIGKVALWWCGRAGEAPLGAGGPADARRGLRWERLADILQELRGAGDRFLATRRRSARLPRNWGDRPLSGVEQPDRGDPGRP